MAVHTRAREFLTSEADEVFFLLLRGITVPCDVASLSTARRSCVLWSMLPWSRHSLLLMVLPICRVSPFFFRFSCSRPGLRGLA